MYKIMQYENWWGHKKRLYWINNIIKEGDNCIEVGCGTGAFLTIPLSLLSRDKKTDIVIRGIDIDEASIAMARKNAKQIGLPEDMFLCGDIAEHKEKYDVVICSEVLEHLEDNYLSDFAESLCKLLNPEGRLVVTVPNGQGSYERGQRLKETQFGKYIFPKIEFVMQVFNAHFMKRFLYFDKINNKEEELEQNRMTLSAIDIHVQFFNRDQIELLFKKLGMKCTKFSGSCIFSGAWVNLLPPFQWLTAINNWGGQYRH